MFVVVEENNDTKKMKEAIVTIESFINMRLQMRENWELLKIKMNINLLKLLQVQKLIMQQYKTQQRFIWWQFYTIFWCERGNS